MSTSSSPRRASGTVSSLRFDDEFELRTTVSRLGTTSMTTAIEVVRDGDVVAEGELRHVFLAREGGAADPDPGRGPGGVRALSRVGRMTRRPPERPECSIICGS